MRWLRLVSFAGWLALWFSPACGDRSVGGVGDAGTPDSGHESRRDGATTWDGAPRPCRGLSLAECRRRPDCAADVCFLCSCRPVFEQCRKVTEPPYDCPLLDCPQPPCCQAQSDCAGIGDCVPPGSDAPACGVCNQDPGNCTMDADCPRGQICEPIPCSCEGRSHCVPGCTKDTDCPVGSVCGQGDHPRCEPQPCDADRPCPEDFDCTGGACQRRACTQDLDCDHYCVLGACYDGYGACEVPAA